MIDIDSTVNDVVTRSYREGDKIVVQRTQDVEGYLEQNKRELNEAPSWRPYAGDGCNMRKVASIPMIVIEQWMKEGINIFDPSPETQRKIADKLNSNEYAALRTYPGRVGVRT